MPAYTNLTGLLGSSTLIVVALLQLPRVKHLPKRYLALLTATVFLLCLLPFGGLPLAGYVRGMVGDLSITTIVLLLIALLHPYRVLVDVKQRYHLLMVMALAAIFLYPLALGVSLYDPYRWGYSSMQFIATVLLIAMAALLIQERLVALCLTLATLAWSVGWYESSNMWDYLIDPLVAVYAIWTLARAGICRLFFYKG